jgi:hypothetical protein
MEQATTPKLGNLMAAYCKAFSEIDNVVKNAANPHFGSNYADLGAVLDTVRPVFAANGLALMTIPGEMDGDKVTLLWVLGHASGESINGKMSLPIGPKATAQAAGSAYTYMRRYLNAAIGAIAQVDDDGNQASRDTPAPAPRAAKQAPRAGTYADGVAALLTAIEGCATLEALDALKPQIAELGDQAVADKFVSRKKALRGK